MFRWIYLEIKQMLFNRKNLMVFVALLITHILVLSYYSSDDDIRTNKIEELTLKLEMNSSDLHSISPQYKEMIREQRDFNEKMLNAITNKDINEYNKLILIEELKNVNATERYLLSIERPDYGSLKEKVDSYFHNHDLHLELKEKIFQEFGYRDTSSTMGRDLSIYNSRVAHLEYQYEVYDNGFMHYDEPSRDSMTITLTVFRQYLIYLVLLVPLIVGFDAFKKDKKEGSIRTIMALKQKRYQYLLVKMFAALTVSLIIIILPLFLALLINNVNIVNDLKYPSYVYTKGLTSFEAINPVMIHDGVFINYNADYALDLYSFHSRAVFNVNKFGYVIGVHGGVTLLTLASIMGYSLILVTFLILFVLSIQLALSINLSENIGLIVSVIILGLLFLLTFNRNLSSFDEYTRRFMHVPSLIETLNPMSYLKAVDVVEGTVPFTFLGGVVVLSIYSTIITTISALFLKRKDITF